MDPVGKHDRKVARADALARRVITLGSAITILSVAAIVAFIFVEVAPLLLSPRIRKANEWVASERLTPGKGIAIGTDDYRQTAFRVDNRGSTGFLALDSGALIKIEKDVALEGKRIVCASRATRRNWIAFGTDDGYAGSLEVKYLSAFAEGKRVLSPSVNYGPLIKLSPTGESVILVSGTVDGDGNSILAGYGLRMGLIAASYGPDGGVSKVSPVETHGETITALAIKSSGENLVAGTLNGYLLVFSNSSGVFTLVEKFKAAAAEISSLAFLAGDQALIIGDAKGGISEWFAVRYLTVKNSGSKTAALGEGIVVHPGEALDVIDRNYSGRPGIDPALVFSDAGMRFLKIRSFQSHEGRVKLIAPSPRDKGFVTVGEEGAMMYHYSTSGRTYGIFRSGQAPELAAFAPKSNGLIALGNNGMLYNYSLEVRHPEITAGTLFQKVWYEGYPGPEYVWQSSGGTDDFEPKLSLVPLIFGTLKGTFYAMFFSVPIAILGAVYLSQMASPSLRNIVKPLIEMMAAIPSVVVGFLAGLWLAPALNNHTATLFTMAASVPLGWFITVCIWWVLPKGVRPEMGGKRELPFLLLVVAVSVVAGHLLSIPLDRFVFHGDLKQWMHDSFGIFYDPRNCVVVGFALGFAVIPIIFTISEDALSAVPPSLTTASFALAASRWQTALYVVLPAASPGIFAAVMLGLGRAVGETMIVLMATGNTPIMDMSIFNGMRAMSAAIAVEIPEAPVGGGLYRVLFLVGFLLFAFTFVINTLAEVVSVWLRRKYSRF